MVVSAAGADPIFWRTQSHFNRPRIRFDYSPLKRNGSGSWLAALCFQLCTANLPEKTGRLLACWDFFWRWTLGFDAELHGVAVPKTTCEHVLEQPIYMKTVWVNEERPETTKQLQVLTISFGTPAVKGMIGTGGNDKTWNSNESHEFDHSSTMNWWIPCCTYAMHVLCLTCFVACIEAWHKTLWVRNQAWLNQQQELMSRMVKKCHFMYMLLYVISFTFQLCWFLFSLPHTFFFSPFVEICVAFFFMSTTIISSQPPKILRWPPLRAADEAAAADVFRARELLHWEESSSIEAGGRSLG